MLDLPFNLKISGVFFLYFLYSILVLLRAKQRSLKIKTFANLASVENIDFTTVSLYPGDTYNYIWKKPD